MDTRLWQKIVASYKANPRDVKTTPITNREGKWFFVYAERNDIFIESGRSHANKSTIEGRIRLDKNNLDEVLELQRLRERGMLRRAEAREKTYYSSYWFGILDELRL